MEGCWLTRPPPARPDVMSRRFWPPAAHVAKEAQAPPGITTRTDGQFGDHDPNWWSVRHAAKQTDKGMHSWPCNSPCVIIHGLVWLITSSSAKEMECNAVTSDSRHNRGGRGVKTGRRAVSSSCRQFSHAPSQNSTPAWLASRPIVQKAKTSFAFELHMPDPRTRKQTRDHSTYRLPPRSPGDAMRDEGCCMRAGASWGCFPQPTVRSGDLAFHSSAYPTLSCTAAARRRRRRRHAHPLPPN